MRKITGENPFQVNESSFAVSPSQQEYTLNYSADGKNFTAWPDATPAGETLVVNGCPQGLYLKLVGNQSEVTINF